MPAHAYALGMRQLSVSARARIVSCLVEGNSVRSTCRITGAAKRTVLKLLADIGTACRAYHDEHVVEVRSTRIQCDEIWAFVFAKDKNVLEDEKRYGIGSIWTWTAIDADSKLLVGSHVGTRDAACAHEFIEDVASRLVNRVQLFVVVDHFLPPGITRRCRFIRVRANAMILSASAAYTEMKSGMRSSSSRFAFGRPPSFIRRLTCAFANSARSVRECTRK